LDNNPEPNDANEAYGAPLLEAGNFMLKSSFSTAPNQNEFLGPNREEETIFSG
jgi:hypothetical protein